MGEKIEEKKKTSDDENWVFCLGGHGSNILTGVKRIHNPQRTVSIPTVFDSGGSTGDIRKKYNVIAFGDAGMHMKAFMDPSRIPLEWQIIFRKRFRKDVKSTFAGHSMSNIIMLALTEEYGLEGMFAMLGKMLGIKQRIIPISLDYSHVNALTDKGEIEGEAAIDTRSPDCPRVIRNIQLEPPARIYIKAAEAIEQADKLIWGPGDMRTSIRPITCVVGVKESVAKARQKRGTKVILVCNLMTKKSETPGYTTATFARELCESLGIEKLDYTLFNTKAIRQDVLASYAKDGQYPVRFENALECGTIYSGNFLEYDGEYHIRHSPQAVANAIALL